jgi:hypothetical protein
MDITRAIAISGVKSKIETIWAGINVVVPMPDMGLDGQSFFMGSAHFKAKTIESFGITPGTTSRALLRLQNCLVPEIDKVHVRMGPPSSDHESDDCGGRFDRLSLSLFVLCPGA